MKPISSSRIALTSLVVLAVAGSLASAQSTGVVDSVKELMKKLDAVAASQRFTSGITLEELRSVFKAYKNADVETKNKIKHDRPLRLVLDLAITPLTFVYEHLHDSPTLYALHLNRIEKAYKKFKPAYGGRIIGNGDFAIKTKNTMRLYNMLANKDGKTEVTMLAFQRAKMEADNWRARLEELTTNEDIFVYLDELENIMNYFNTEVFGPLYRHIYPKLDQFKDAESARKAYYDHLLRDHGIKLIRGSPTRVNGQKVAKTGFVDIFCA